MLILHNDNVKTVYENQPLLRPEVSVFSTETEDEGVCISGLPIKNELLSLGKERDDS